MKYRMIFLFIIGILLAQICEAQESPHGDIKLKCATCHSADSWKMRTDSAFDHSVTGFALTGQHKQMACVSCHEKLVFTKKSPDCASCHTDIHKSELGSNCERCHSTVTWLIPDMKEKHQQTRFPLQGKHLIADCEECHNRVSPNRYAGTPLECISCHKADYDATTAPPHAASGFGLDCAPCHAVSSLTWPGAFNHASTGFPLLGAHQALLCAACHKNNSFTVLPTTCFGCHQTDFTNAQNPSHVSGNFSHDCTTCHNLTAWKPATFDHTTTHFPLTGAHTTTACEACHTNGNYQLVYQSCYQCHQSNYQATNNPNHTTLNYSHTCDNCHNTTSWSNATIDHSTTRFPLTGAHISLQCASCHVNNNFNLTYTDCYQCHQANYQSTNDPNHVSLNYSHNCLNCHNTNSWGNATIDHTVTGFALTGAHQTVSCATCHVNNNFNLALTNCYQCHQSEYSSTNDPNHTTLNYSHSCDNCHNTSSWSNATIDHSTTGFPLTGAHISLQCSSCHVNNNFNLAYTDCYQCHQSEYLATNDPNHTSLNYSHSCDNCHSTTSWANATINHSTTGFALIGAHVSLQCSACHVNNNYNLTYTDCYQCHQSDYNRPTDPNHTSANFSHDCTGCHSQTVWTGGQFNHSATNFQLTGAHVALACASCHVNQNYAIKYTDCYQCHQADYQRPTDPNHTSANFSHDCTGCHTTTVWTGGQFNHSTTNFQITGAHVSLACASCHVNQNYTIKYSGCYTCHATDYNGTTNPNHASAGFPTTCETCHSTTSWAGATFNHTWFPTSHGSANGVCATCHTNPSDYSVFQCTVCHTQASTTSQHSGVSGFVWNSVNCYSCHPNGRGG